MYSVNKWTGQRQMDKFTVISYLRIEKEGRILK